MSFLKKLRLGILPTPSDFGELNPERLPQLKQFLPKTKLFSFQSFIWLLFYVTSKENKECHLDIVSFSWKVFCWEMTAGRVVHTGVCDTLKSAFISVGNPVPQCYFQPVKWEWMAKTWHCVMGLGAKDFKHTADIYCLGKKTTLL